MPRKPLSIPQAAAALSRPEWQLRRIFKEKLAPEPPRVGPYRVVDEADLPKLREILERRFPVKADEPAAR